MSYPLRSLLIVMTGLALLCGVAMLPWPAGWFDWPDWVADGWPYFAPGIVTIVVYGVAALARPRWAVPAALAIAACALALASAPLLVWYTREVQGDRTANIGAGILLLATPILAPLAAAFGWVIGWVATEAWRDRPRGEGARPGSDSASTPGQASEDRSSG